ncbi:hypothetical protein BJY52DRAFT_684503 [Lactarius psammicola]|nr:hypothetical protein BJY52DRAFT_684503 [Lactarius psammicola]
MPIHPFCHEEDKRLRFRSCTRRFDVTDIDPCHATHIGHHYSDLSRCSCQCQSEAKSSNGQYSQDASHKNFKYVRHLPLLIPTFDRLAWADLVLTNGRSIILTIFRRRMGHIHTFLTRFYYSGTHPRNWELGYSRPTKLDFVCFQPYSVRRRAWHQGGRLAI